MSVIRMTGIAVAVAVALVIAAPGTAGNFNFKRQTPNNSTLKWEYACGTGLCSTQWRSGAGTTTNECQINQGWLPSGWYSRNAVYHNYDAVIKGRAFWVQDKQCSNGTWRTELFIHSEETVSQGQQCTSNPDDPYCWEGTNDYYSNGCIKLNHATQIGAAHTHLHDTTKGGSSSHGSTTMWLTVHN
ncbi:MAG: hypothetical protein U0R69_02435 [Gaiellales bacterium]